jgi:hypothetical protein
MSGIMSKPAKAHASSASRISWTTMPWGCVAPTDFGMGNGSIGCRSGSSPSPKGHFPANPNRRDPVIPLQPQPVSGAARRLERRKLFCGKLAGYQFADHVADRLIPRDRTQLQPFVQAHRQIDDQPMLVGTY